MINNVKIIPGCIACRNCEKICPLVFKVQGQSEVISQDTAGIEEQVLEAARMCPVQVIKVDHNGERQEKEVAQFISKTMLNKHIVELHFAAKNFKYTPGQYVSLFMEDAKGSFSRAYSIADADKKSFTLTIKLLNGGRGSTFLRNLKNSEKWQASYLGPHGFFKLASTKKKQLYIGTGAGLAPLYAMMKSSPRNPKKLLIGARKLEDHYRLDKLQKLQNLELSVVVSQPEELYSGLRGRVTDYLDDACLYDEFYLCGNPNMVSQVKQQLLQAGIAEEDIYEELYTTALDIQPQSRNPYFMNTINSLLIGVARGCVVGFLLRQQYGLLRDISRWSVVVLMAIRPLADLFGNIHILRKAVVLRQGLGILSSIIVVSILIYTTIGNGENILQIYSDPTQWSLSSFAFFARLSEITAVLLLITSNRLSQKLLGPRWKRLHKIAYIYFYAAGIYIYSLGKISAFRSMIFITVLLIAAIIKNKNR